MGGIPDFADMLEVPGFVDTDLEAEDEEQNAAY